MVPLKCYMINHSWLVPMTEIIISICMKKRIANAKWTLGLITKIPIMHKTKPTICPIRAECQNGKSNNTLAETFAETSHTAKVVKNFERISK